MFFFKTLLVVLLSFAVFSTMARDVANNPKNIDVGANMIMDVGCHPACDEDRNRPKGMVEAGEHMKPKNVGDNSTKPDAGCLPDCDKNSQKMNDGDLKMKMDVGNHPGRQGDITRPRRMVDAGEHMKLRDVEENTNKTHVGCHHPCVEDSHFRGSWDCPVKGPKRMVDAGEHMKPRDVGENTDKADIGCHPPCKEDVRSPGTWDCPAEG